MRLSSSTRPSADTAHAGSVRKGLAGILSEDQTEINAPDGRLLHPKWFAPWLPLCVLDADSRA